MGHQPKHIACYFHIHSNWKLDAGDPSYWDRLIDVVVLLLNCPVCWAHCPLQLTPSLPCSSHRKLLTRTGTMQLSHAGLAIPIGVAIYDLCSKCNIQPQFRPQNGLAMQLCIAYVLLVDPKVLHAKNEPDLWRTESTRGAQTYIPEQLYLYRFNWIFVNVSLTPWKKAWNNMCLE